MSVATVSTTSYADLPIEVRMRILKYSHPSSTEKIMNMFKSPESTEDEMVLKINKNKIKDFMCIVKDMIVSVLIFTKYYDETHMSLVYGMSALKMRRRREIAVAHGIHDPEGQVTVIRGVKLFTYGMILHNMKQYKEVLDSRKECAYTTDMLAHRDVLLVSVGYPTKNKNTKTYTAYNDMVEKLRKSSYNVKIVYLII